MKTGTAIILCGGRSVRFGRDKALLEINGIPMIRRMIDRVSSAVDAIIIVARDQVQGNDIAKAIPDDVRIVYDSVAGYGPIAGILAGLSASKSEYAICLACDLPYINPDVIDALFEYAEGNDAAIPQHPDGRLEPLHAVYGRSMADACREAMGKKEHSIRGAISLLDDVVFVPAEPLRRFDCDLRTFLNVNYPEDLWVMV